MNGSRIQLREHVIGDMEAFCELQMDPKVGRYVSWLPRTRQQCEIALLDAIEQQHARERVRYFFAVDVLTTGDMIGTVGYTRIEWASADCGWFLRTAYWGHGYGSEAVRALVSLARGDRG